MKRVVISIVFFFYALSLLCFIDSSAVFADQNLLSTTVVIAGVQVKGSNGANSSSQEAVAIQNISSTDIDISNWCLAYAPASSTTVPTTTAGCAAPPDANTRVFLPAGSSASFATNDYKLAHPTMIPDFAFTSGLSNSAGHIYLLAANAAVVDRVGWGNAQNPETTSVQLLANSLGFSRTQETGNNAVDFNVFTTDFALPANKVYEIVDVCSNLDGNQSVAPDGYSQKPDGNCVKNPATNYCLQAEITELLPDPIGDTGNNGEFIELHNPTAEPIPLAGCQLFVGSSYSQHISLPDVELAPDSYQAFPFEDTGLQLSNSNGRAKLATVNGNVVSETAAYSTIAEGSSWALIDGGWQVTEKPTPNAPNELIITPGLGAGNAEVIDQNCPAGKYRNPETNRCKAAETLTTTLTPCNSDEERNPITHRCRKTTSATNSLTPCAPGQERNPDTNRCRKVSTDDNSPKPCQSGYERNPDTNRCRKSTIAFNTNSSNDPKGGSAISGLPINVGWIAAGIIGTGAAGYGLYEWRFELIKIWQKLRGKVFRGQPSDETDTM